MTVEQLYRRLDRVIDARARNYINGPEFERERTKLRSAIARAEERAKPDHRKGAIRAE